MRRKLLILHLVAALSCAYGTEQAKRRAPSGFTGVRGKKSIPDSVYSDTSQNELSDVPEDGSVDKRAPSGFMGMRGKKFFTEPDGGLSDDLLKRAPSGFFGMRGKKDSEDNYEDDFSKRTPSGFMGMRGKKEYDYDLDSSDYMDKRAPSGFMGMRGKKNYENIINDLKRAQMSGFFGMRGKKQPARSGFFGMRGKKYPYEFRGKFVGVRGKKSSNEVENYGYLNGNLGKDEQFKKLAQGLDLNQLMLLLTENDDSFLDNANEYLGYKF